MRSNFGLLICNMTGSDLKIREKTRDNDKFKNRILSQFKGLLHIRHIMFDQIVDDKEIDADDQTE